MMAQFLEIKERHPDALLFYRMGDFYEMFFDDAVAAAEALDIALTKRGKHLGNDIPMCGVPVHAAENYLLTLIRKGFRVAVCEQLENPAEAKKRGSKSVVKRDVVRLVTPGTLTEDTLLNARRNNFLAAFSEIRGESALAWVDISTGEFRVCQCPIVRLSPDLARLAPSEVILAEDLAEKIQELVEESGAVAAPLSRASFDSTSSEKRILSLFSVDSLEAFGQFTRAEISALGGIIDYLEITQKGKLPLIRPPVRETTGKALHIDAATRKNLELTQSLSGGRKGSLIDAIDRTLTPSGGRLLDRRLASPSTDIAVINRRLDALDWLLKRSDIRGSARDTLRKAPDIERALSRLAMERGGPRDLSAIRGGLRAAITLAKALKQEDVPELFADAPSNLASLADVLATLEKLLIEEPPLLARDGGFISDGYSDELNEARTLRDDGRQVVAGLQKDYTELSKVSALKIKHNNVLGYFIETPATHAEKMLSEPLSKTFIHRQTTANAVRFTTVELSGLETKILNAGSRAIELEKIAFEHLRKLLLESATELGEVSQTLAELDLSAGLADLAVSQDYSRPQVDTSRDFEIVDGRHPVVEQALKSGGGDQFIANSCDLTAEAKDAKISLLTGPNMSGKSTFLRQNAIITILAQMGSFVPAKSARLGLVSQVFSRVGASDDLARGRSTFMVEMVETAAILNQADDRAFVILDEIGRGTSTYDGLSIAWATLEHLHEVNRCRALFATHYHELTALAGKLQGVENATVAVREWEGDVIFLHEVHSGAADRSYGVQVAKLAGLPASVVTRARVVLDALEKGKRESGGKQSTLIDDLPLFSAQPSAPALAPKTSEVEEALTEISPDALTPREALQLLYDLKDMLARS